MSNKERLFKQMNCKLKHDLPPEYGVPIMMTTEAREPQNKALQGLLATGRVELVEWTCPGCGPIQQYAYVDTLTSSTEPT